MCCLPRWYHSQALSKVLQLTCDQIAHKFHNFKECHIGQGFQCSRNWVSGGIWLDGLFPVFLEVGTWMFSVVRASGFVAVLLALARECEFFSTGPWKPESLS